MEIQDAAPPSTNSRHPVGQTSQFLRDNPFGNTEFLIERARAGSDTAWREFYRRYRTMLLVQVRSRVSGQAHGNFAAEEALQNAFAKAWLNIRDFEYRGEGSFRRYMCTLVLNEFLGQAQARCIERPLRATELQQVDDREARERAEKDRAMESKRSMLEKLGELDAEDREVLSMRYFEELTFERMALVLECSRETARVLCRQAIERLARSMEA